MPRRERYTFEIRADDKASAAIDKVNREFRELDRQTSKIQGPKFDLVSKGALAATAAVGGLTAGIFAAGRAFNEFNRAANEARSLTGESVQQFADLRRGVLELSASMGTDATASAKALYQAISAGVPRDNALEFLGTASKAAIAGLTDAEVAVDGITTVLNAFSLEATEAGRVADVFFAAVEKGKTTFPELADNISQAANVAANIGVEFEELLAIVAQLTTTGTRTPQAFTQVRAALVALQNPTAEMAKLLKAQGFETGRTAIASQGLARTLQLLKAEAADDQELVKALGRVEGLGAVLGVSGTQADAFREKLDAVQQSAGKASAAFQVNSDNLDNANKKLSSSFLLLVDDFDKMLGVTEKLNAALLITAGILQKVSSAVDAVEGNRFFQAGGRALAVLGGFSRFGIAGGLANPFNNPTARSLLPGGGAQSFPDFPQSPSPGAGGLPTVGAFPFNLGGAIGVAANTALQARNANEFIGPQMNDAQSLELFRRLEEERTRVAEAAARDRERIAERARAASEREFEQARAAADSFRAAVRTPFEQLQRDIVEIKALDLKGAFELGEAEEIIRRLTAQFKELNPEVKKLDEEFSRTMETFRSAFQQALRGNIDDWKAFLLQLVAEVAAVQADEALFGDEGLFRDFDLMDEMLSKLTRNHGEHDATAEQVGESVGQAIGQGARKAMNAELPDFVRGISERPGEGIFNFPTLEGPEPLVSGPTAAPSGGRFPEGVGGINPILFGGAIDEAVAGFAILEDAGANAASNVAENFKEGNQTILDSIAKLIQSAVSGFASLAKTAFSVVGSALGNIDLTGLFSFIPGFDGGGFTGGGARAGGLDGRGGFMALLHPNEQVVDLTRGGGAVTGVAGGITVVNHIQPGVSQEMIPQIMEATKQGTLAALRDEGRRGGRRARTLGF